MSIMDGMVARERLVDGVPTSLCDLGYCDVGLDDNWQDCGAGGANYTFHLDDGSPVVDLSLFPDFKQMTDHAHALGLTAGWYGNNCICSERNTDERKFYEGDVAAFRAFGFDSWKLDGCGAQTDLALYDALLNASGAPVVVENCHWGSKVPFEPNATWCPWNFYRTSGDVRASYDSVVGNLETAIGYADRGLSTPGCWAYPDMLEVGCAHGPGGAHDPGLTPEETRAHFGAWAIVSSPLTLSHDVNNATIMDAIWPVIANVDAIAVNQAWYGHSGTRFKSAPDAVVLGATRHAAVEPWMTRADVAALGPQTAAAWQYLYKPLNATHTSVLLMNSADAAVDLTLYFGDVPDGPCAAACDVYDVWARAPLGKFDEAYNAKALASHDAAFLILSAPAST